MKDLLLDIVIYPFALILALSVVAGVILLLGSPIAGYLLGSWSVFFACAFVGYAAIWLPFRLLTAVDDHRLRRRRDKIAHRA